MNNSRYYQYNMRTVVHCAPGASIRIPTLFEGLGAKRVLLVSDKGLVDAGLVQQIQSVFEHNSQGAVKLAGVYTDILPDASSSSVNDATKFARSLAVDSILAVGGGSVIDASKGIKYALHNALTDIGDALQTGIKIEAWPKQGAGGIPHIGVPTTAGTGAEASAIAVFLNEEMNIKSNLVSPGLEPDIAVLDANLTLGLPPSITAATGMDALTHAIEAIASPASNCMTDAHAFMAAQLIMENLPLVVEDGSNVIARSNMLQASTMAIDAFFGCLNAVPVHNCAHAFGAMFHIPHGDANAALLPIVLDEMKNFYTGQGARLAKAVNVFSEGKSDTELVSDATVAIKNLTTKINTPTNFQKWGVTSDNRDAIMAAIASDPAAMFLPLSPQAVNNIIDRLL